MNEQSVTIKKDTFKSPILPIIEVAFTIAAICGIVAVGYLFHPDSIPAIIQDIILGQIYDPSAQQTWLAVYIITTVLNCLYTVVLSAGILLIVLGRKYLGINFLHNSATYAVLCTNISGIVVLLYFIFRAIKYIIICCQDLNEGILPLIAAILMEGVMLTLACVVFFKLRQFLKCCTESTASISYTLHTNKIQSPSIPPFSVSGFLILGLIAIVMALDRFYTFAYSQVQVSVVYMFRFTTDPIQIFSGLSFSFAALGSILLFLYLRSYKRKSEMLLFCSSKTVTE